MRSALEEGEVGAETGRVVVAKPVPPNQVVPLSAICVQTVRKSLPTRVLFARLPAPGLGVDSGVTNTGYRIPLFLCS